MASVLDTPQAPNGAGIQPGPDILTYIKHAFGVPASLMSQMTPMETILTESLLTPGLQTTVKVHSYFDNIPIKDLNQFKGVTGTININRPINAIHNAGAVLDVQQTVYRLGMFKNVAGRPGTRKLINDRIEEFTIHMCDPTLLNDAKTLVANSWKCTPPSAIVAEMLACVKARATDVEGSCCPRDYVARTIHPFQVINQQADAALSIPGGNPSFLHYMTYENLGTHKFRSLDSLVKQTPVGTYVFQDTGTASGGYAYVYGVMTYNFPCDFDLLADILNGIGPNGINLSSVVSFIPFLRQAGFVGTTPSFPCNDASTVLKAAMSVAPQQQGCPDYSQFFALKRQARLSLLEENKLALNMTVPWNPDLNAGKVITLKLLNKVEPTLLNYGSGDYLIHTVKHNIQYGGFATTTLDCVSTTVGQGIV